MTAVATLEDAPQVEDWSALLERQRQLEDNAMADGADRFRKRLEQAESLGASSSTGAARQMIQSALLSLENAILSTIEHRTGGRGKGKQPLCVKWCSLVGADVASYMTLKVVLDATSSGNPASIHKIADSISTLILDELRYRRFKEQAPELFRYKMESFETSNPGHKARSLKASMQFAKIDTKDLELRNSARLRIGFALLDLMCESTGWFQCGHLTDPSKKHGTKTVIVMNPETQHSLSAKNDLLALLTPIAGPMVVPPLNWGPGRRGGYRFGLRGKYDFVRRSDKARARKLADAKMPVVYEAVNRIQNTAWRINIPVLELVEEIISLGGGYAGLPKSKNDPLPSQPEDIETNEDARKQWRTDAHVARNRNHTRKVEAAEVTRLLAEAQSLADEGALYFPHSLDFRGRVYPIASRLNPQGDDLSRALLTFAEGKPVDEEGARWLAIHGANMMGVTPDGLKVSAMTLDQRVEWIEDNRERIFEVADSPFDTAWWIRADKPLQFYAFAVEWTAYLRANEEGEEYVSSLPCHMDGTANGLQHFAALLLDPISAKAVNVTPQDRPQDIYQYVADSVLSRLTADAAIDPFAALWLTLHQQTGIVDRKLCKRPAMTFAYGSKLYGFTKQIDGYLRELENYREIKAHFTQDGKAVLRAASRYMARVIWDSLKDTAVSAFDAMTWMSKVAWGITKNNKSITWTAPTGFPVYQGYFQTRKHQIVTTLAGRIIKPKCSQPTEKVDRQKEANAIAPNAVHSLDAAALHLTVVQAAKEGIASLSTLHDSYGTVASDCPALARILRETFIGLYSEDVIGTLHDQFSRQWSDPADCPLPPSQGTLDLQTVKEAQFFFC